MSMRTPLGKVRGLGSAKSGTEHFWQQRLTAIANIPLVIFLAWFCVSKVGADRAEMAQALSNPLVALMLVFTIISITWHMRLGMQVVIEDYVHGEGSKLICLLGNTFFSLAVALTGLFAVLKISFGG
ncbi:succinate dehydrogenase, hydrophobic membrane anchor protein [Anderseniella sp. Alg231-50]|uniref:succinate dehydrogenase, hydrophobic membrane anchor protein n=1 Tax=Anderseniella sp. Alg231-50 TaxID=1922226 RepID=UPI000D54E1D3